MSMRRHLGISMFNIAVVMAMVVLGAVSILLDPSDLYALGSVAEQTVDGQVVERHKLSSRPHVETVFVDSGRSGYYLVTGVWVREPDGSDRLLNMADGTTLTHFGWTRSKAWKSVVEVSPIGYGLTTQDGNTYASSRKPHPEQGGFEILQPKGGELHLTDGLKVRTFVTGQEKAWSDYVAKTETH